MPIVAMAIDRHLWWLCKVAIFLIFLKVNAEKKQPENCANCNS